MVKVSKNNSSEKKNNSKTTEDKGKGVLSKKISKTAQRNSEFTLVHVKVTLCDLRTLGFNDTLHSLYLAFQNFNKNAGVIIHLR